LLPVSNGPMTWRLDRHQAGSGALGDLGAHIIDLGRFLVGEFRSVSALTRTFTTQRRWTDRPGMGTVDVDDAFVAAVEFESGAIGSVEASRYAPGRKNYNAFEINGELGSICFDLERLNELQVYWVNDEPRTTQGFHDVLVTESYHPFWKHWWPHGHIIGWEHTFVHEIAHLLDAIANDRAVAPYGATFEDGYRNAVVCDAILKSAESGERIPLRY